MQENKNKDSRAKIAKTYKIGASPAIVMLRRTMYILRLNIHPVR